MTDTKFEKEVEGTDQERVYKQDDQQNRVSGIQEYNMYESSDWQDSAIIQEKIMGETNITIHHFTSGNRKHLTK